MLQKRIIPTLMFFTLITTSIFGNTASNLSDSIAINNKFEEYSELSFSKDLIPKYEQLAEASKKIGFKKGIIYANIWLGNKSVEQGEIDKALGHYKIADEVSTILNDPILIVKANYSFAFLYHSIGDYDQAIEKNLIAKEIAIKINQKETLALIENGLGVLYAQKGDYQKSINSFEKSKQIFFDLKDLAGIDGCNYNIAESRINQGKPELAFEPAFDNLDYSKKNNNTNDIAYSYQLIAKAYFGSKDFEKSVVYADSSLIYSEKNNLKYLDLETYPILYKSYEALSDISKSYAYFKIYHKADKVFHNESVKKDLSELEVQYETSKKEKELIKTQNEIKDLEQSAQIRMLGLWMLIGGMLMAAISAYFFFSRLKAKAREKAANQQLIMSELKNKELEASQLQTKLAHKESDLTNLALDIGRKNEYANQIIIKLEELQKVRPEEMKSKVRDIIHYTTNQLQLNDDVAVLQENVDTVNQEFYQRLESRFGKLTNNEKYLTGLIRLNLANKEIAAIKGISATSVKTSRHRLRKRLELEPKVDIVDFLQKM